MSDKIRIAVMVNDGQLDGPIANIIDILRNGLYQVGFNEQQIPEYDVMVVNLTNSLEEDIINIIGNCVNVTYGLMEHIDDYYPALTEYVREPTVNKYLCEKYLTLINFLSRNFQGAVMQLTNNNYFPSALEKFNVNMETSYYVITGESGKSHNALNSL